MARLIKRFESCCVFCGEKSKAETVQGIRACTTCGAEDPDHVPFYSENEALLNARKARCGGFGAMPETTMCFESKKPKCVKKTRISKRLAKIIEEDGRPPKSVRIGTFGKKKSVAWTRC